MYSSLHALSPLQRKFLLVSLIALAEGVTVIGAPFNYGMGGGKLVAVPKIRKLERNASPEFEFLSLSSNVEIPYADFPTESSFSWNMNNPDLLFGDACDVQLVLDLIDYQQVPTETSVTVCLFQGNATAMNNLFVPNQKLDILGNKFDPILYFRKLRPVSGFVMGEFHSLVQGFLIEEHFYGSIRLFDILPHHHILFHVEPFRNLGLYNSQLRNLTREPGLNAALFEYIRHEDDSRGEENTKSEDYPSFEGKTHENLESGRSDVSERVKLKKGSTSSNMFDIRKDDSTICEICVWVQPNFAQKFGLRGGVPYGVGEIMNILSFVQFVFQGIDFNGDQFADEIEIIIKEFQVTDDISIQGGIFSGKVYEKTKRTTERPEERENGRRRRREEEDLTNEKESSYKDNSTSQPTNKKKGNYVDYETFELEEPFTEETVTMDPREAHERLRTQLVRRFAKKKCCGILGYVYHNLVPKLSYATVGGICSGSHNVGVVSGFLHGHKVGKFDIFRSTVHVLGHLFGAKEDDIGNPDCKKEAVETPRIFNPSLMDSFHKIDVGLRPNSFRFSICAKLDITAFLTTKNANCLRATKKIKPKCGNGVVEAGEECDCGLLWQCHSDEMEKPSCCGESDTFVGCRKIGALRYRMNAHCHRPFLW